MRGTSEVVPLPPFFGAPPPSRNGQHPAAEDRLSGPESETRTEPTVEAILEPTNAVAQDLEPAAEFSQDVEPAAELAEPVVASANEAPMAEPTVDLTWETADGEGTVEPVFEEDVHATEEMLAERARGVTEFPMDAFIIPEDAERLPTGVSNDENVDGPSDGATTEIAARFEHISKLLREEDVNELLVRLARGDRLDALLAGFLAGYLSTHDA